MFEQDKKNIYKYALQVYNKKNTYKGSVCPNQG